MTIRCVTDRCRVTTRHVAGAESDATHLRPTLVFGRSFSYRVWRECEPGVAEVHCSNCVHAMMAATREMSMNARDLHVKKLREQGFTWVQIGECLGMTPRQVKRSREAIAASAKVSGEKAQ